MNSSNVIIPNSVLPHSWSARELAGELGLTVQGDGDAVITGLSSMSGVGRGLLSFAESQREVGVDRSYAGSIIICHEGLVVAGATLLYTPTPRLAFALAAKVLIPQAPWEPGIHPSAHIDPTANIDSLARIEANVVVEAGASVGARARVMPNTYIGPEVSVGDDTIICPNVTLFRQTLVGSRCKIGAGAVLGGDGFGHVMHDPAPVRFPQLGRVRIEDDVEIGANACVDRGALSDTVIEQGARLDNFVQIAHGASVGASSLLAAFVGLAGRAVVGRRTLMGGRSSVKEGVRLGDDCKVAAYSGVTKDEPAGSSLGGFPARPHKTWLKGLARIARLERT